MSTQPQKPSNAADVARRLAAPADAADATPPPGLLEKIRSEIPAGLSVAPELAARLRAEAGTAQAAAPGRRRWLLAASLAAAVGGGALALHLLETLPGPRREERRAATAVASPPAPTPAPPQTAPQAPPQAALQAPPHPIPPAARAPRAVPPPPAVPKPPAAPAPPTPPAAAAAPREEAFDAFESPASADRAAAPMAKAQRARPAEPSARERSALLAGQAPARPPLPAGGAFVDTAADRQSSFALDLAAEPAGPVRRDLDRGHLPSPASVRLGDLVDSFSYGDEPPARGDFSLRVEGAPPPFAVSSGSSESAGSAGNSASYRLLRFGVRAAEGSAARDAEVRIDFDPAAVVRWRPVGGAPRPTLAAGRSATALYLVELRPEAGAGQPLATLRLRYRAADSGEAVETACELRVGDLADRWESAAPGLRLASLVARFGEVLAGPAQPGARAAGLAELLDRCRRLAAELAGGPLAGEAADLARLVERAARLAP